MSDLNSQATQCRLCTRNSQCIIKLIRNGSSLILPSVGLSLRVARSTAVHPSRALNTGRTPALLLPLPTHWEKGVAFSTPPLQLLDPSSAWKSSSPHSHMKQMYKLGHPFLKNFCCTLTEHLNLFLLQGQWQGLCTSFSEVIWGEGGFHETLSPCCYVLFKIKHNHHLGAESASV